MNSFLKIGLAIIHTAANWGFGWAVPKSVRTAGFAEFGFSDLRSLKAAMHTYIQNDDHTAVARIFHGDGPTYIDNVYIRDKKKLNHEQVDQAVYDCLRFGTPRILDTILNSALAKQWGTMLYRGFPYAFASDHSNMSSTLLRHWDAELHQTSTTPGAIIFQFGEALKESAYAYCSADESQKEAALKAAKFLLRKLAETKGRIMEGATAQSGYDDIFYRALVATYKNTDNEVVELLMQHPDAIPALDKLLKHELKDPSNLDGKITSQNIRRLVDAGAQISVEDAEELLYGLVMRAGRQNDVVLHEIIEMLVPGDPKEVIAEISNGFSDRVKTAAKVAKLRTDELLRRIKNGDAEFKDISSHLKARG